MANAPRDGKTYICIDLKSFYASVECAERGLDPFTTNLVVADPERSNKTICLAITPAMKALGVKNRCRVFEIPEGVNYIMATPRMALYMQRSAEIYALYLRHVSPDDVHVYSIDECFIDVTAYLTLYKTDARSFARTLADEVFTETGITATAGIGENMFLAKVALDVLAKHEPDGIAELSEQSFRRRMWHHRPITDIWNIGPGIAARLARHGAYTLYDVTRLPEDLLYREFGVNAEFLIDHAWGQEPCTIADIKAYKPSAHSLSNGQVLPCDYSFAEARDALREMVQESSMKLLNEGLAARRVTLHVGYARQKANGSFVGDGCRKAAGHMDEESAWPEFNAGEARGARSFSTTVARAARTGARNYGGFYTTSAARTLDVPTASFHRLLEAALDIYDTTTFGDVAIRRLMLGFGDVVPSAGEQLSLFDQPEDDAKERDLAEAMLAVQKKFGKNAVLMGTSYKEKGTMRERNQQIGGHRA